MTVQGDGLSFNVEVGQTVLARAHLHYQNNFRTYTYIPPQATQRTHAREKKRRRGREGDSSPATDGDSVEEEASEEEQTANDETPTMTFEISLSALLNCLNIFGDTTVKPTSARQQAARDAWKSRQAGNTAGGGGNRPQYGRRSSRFGGNDNDDDDEEEGGDDVPQLRDEALFQRDSARGASTAAPSKKKANVAMVLSWQEEGCPLVLLYVWESLHTIYTSE